MGEHPAPDGTRELPLAGAAPVVAVRPAGPSDDAAIAGALTAGARRQRDLEGSTGWPVPFPVDEVDRGIARNEWFVIEVGTTIVGAFRLVWDDPIFWGPQPPDAGYVHKLVVDPAYAHRGVGRSALAWAAERVRGEGRAYLRLDCLASNRRLVDHYTALGFRRVREVLVGPRGAELLSLLLERPVVPPATSG